MRKFFMFYNYLGAGYGGLQRLHNRTRVDLESIQGIIEFGLKKVLGTNFFPPIGISGRTDRGVNALNALCHFVIHEKDFKEDIYNFSPESICRQLNAFFEGNGTSIRAHRVVEVLPENHSRGNVVSRVYQYRIAVLKDNYYPNCISHKKLSSQLPASELFRCYAITSPFDLEAAYKACRLFLGTYNYKSFMKASLDTQEYTEENYTKTIYRISFNNNNYSDQLKYFDANYEKFDFYDFHITGSGFLRQQVRLIVGVLIAIGQGKAKEDDITAMLNEPSHEHFSGSFKVKNSNRFKSEVASASPYGLYLKEEDDQEKNLLTPFQKQLQDKLALGLKPTVTKYTRVDGSVLTIEKQGTKETSCNLNESPGFVIDTKPDLSVSEVRPWLFISSQDPPNDLQVLIKYGITHILSLFPKFELHESVSNYIVGHYCLDVYDEVNYNFLNTFESGVRIINDTLKSYNSCCSTSSGSDSVKIPKFLVHCNAGISRAPSFVIFYLMKCEIINFEEAYEIVKKSRPLAKPNDGFIKQLKSFSKIS